MKNNKWLLIGLIILLKFTFITSANPSIIISDYSLTPQSLFPGDSTLLTLTIKNAESTASTTMIEGGTTTVSTIGAVLKKIWIEAASDGEHQISSDQEYFDVGYLAPGASITIAFELDSEFDMSEGIYFPNVCIDVKSYQDVNFPIPVNISDESVELLPSDFPKKFAISGSTEISFTIINHRDSKVNDLTVTPETNAYVDLIPAHLFLTNLNPYEQQEIKFSLTPLQTGETNLTFNMSFKNGNNQHYTTVIVPVEISDTLDVQPIFYTIPRTIAQGSSSRLSLEVFNAKTEEITGVIITPITDLIVYPSEYFIGSMDPDDVFSATFDLSTDGLDLGTYDIDFKVSFKQDNNFYETPAISTSIEVIPQSESSQSSLLVPVLSVVSILILAVILYIFLKRRSVK